MKCEVGFWCVIAVAFWTFFSVGVWIEHYRSGEEGSTRSAASQGEKSLPIIFPPPRKLEWLPDWILRLPIKVEATKGLEAPASLLKRELTEIFGDGSIAENGLTIVSLELDTGNFRREEEYAIETGDNKVTLRAHDLQGAFRAVYRLLGCVTLRHIA